MLFCKHDWGMLSDTTTESKLEVVVRSFEEMELKSIKVADHPCDTARKNIQVFSCERCGKLKRFVTEI